MNLKINIKIKKNTNFTINISSKFKTKIKKLDDYILSCYDTLNQIKSLFFSMNFEHYESHFNSKSHI
jgi:hypothetical protein